MDQRNGEFGGTTGSWEKLSGGIAHLLLNLAYRIDYLIVPEGRLLSMTWKTW